MHVRAALPKLPTLPQATSGGASFISDATLTESVGKIDLRVSVRSLCLCGEGFLE